MSYGEPVGYTPLRSQIADYLRVHRGVECDAEQVVVVNGTQQAIDLVARVVLDQGDSVLFENPGYISARQAFRCHGAKLQPLVVDKKGAHVFGTAARQARLIYVTPSHQYPMGVTMPIERRLALLEWARSNGAIILEDDYDSEYRYHQKPIPSLQGLDRDGRTIYVGSFSKVICPGLGIGYAIIPESLVEAFETAMRLTSRPPSLMEQIVLSEFIREGHFVQHLRRMRKTHSERCEALTGFVEQYLSKALEIQGSAAGLHFSAILKKRTKDTRVVELLRDKGVIARALSNYFLDKTQTSVKIPNGLVLGFASSTPQKIRRAAVKLQQVLENVS